MLKVDNLSAKFGGGCILKDISFHLKQGEILGLIGSSGAGKTTLLKCLSQLHPCTGNVVHTHDTSGAMVFQHLHLWPHKSILENITEALIHVHNVSPNKAEKQAMKWLTELQIQNKKKDYPANLSGGEQQRVAIARALAVNPTVLLLDEITASIDQELTVDLLHTLRSLASKGVSMIVVSHDLHFIQGVADRVLFLDNGKIIEQGSPEQIFNAPVNNRTQQFVSKMNYSVPF